MQINHLEQYNIARMINHYVEDKNEVLQLMLDYTKCFGVSLIARHNTDNLEAFFTAVITQTQG